MSEQNERNERLIAEFRANGGRITGRFANSTLLLLHTTGAKSGLERVNPAVYQKVDDSYAIFASKGISKYPVRSREFQLVLRAVLLILVAAVASLVLAALAEVAITETLLRPLSSAG